MFRFVASGVMKIYQKTYPGCADDVEAEIVHLYANLETATQQSASIPPFLVLVVKMTSDFIPFLWTWHACRTRTPRRSRSARNRFADVFGFRRKTDVIFRVQ